jgi:hypothetical protein
MKKALAIIDLFRPKNARAALKRSDDRARIKLEQEHNKLIEESKAQLETAAQLQ